MFWPSLLSNTIRLGLRVEQEKKDLDERKKQKEFEANSIVVKILQDSNISTHEGYDLCYYEDKTFPATEMYTFRFLKEKKFADFKVNLFVQFVSFLDLGDGIFFFAKSLTIGFQFPLILFKSFYRIQLLKV